MSFAKSLRFVYSDIDVRRLQWDDDMHDLVFIKNFNTTSSSHLHISHLTEKLYRWVSRRRRMSLSVMPYSCRFARTRLSVSGPKKGLLLVTVSGTSHCRTYISSRFGLNDEGWPTQMCHASSCKKHQPNQHVRWKIEYGDWHPNIAHMHTPTHSFQHTHIHMCPTGMKSVCLETRREWLCIILSKLYTT